MLEVILKIYGINASQGGSQVIGQGLINATWKIDDEGGRTYILQRVNDAVFKQPFIIDQNLHLLGSFLSEKFPEYIFTYPIPNVGGATLTEFEGSFYRMFHYVPDSHCFDTLQRPQLAYEAAKQFGHFTSILSDFDATWLIPSIVDFHNLSLRCIAYASSMQSAEPKRLQQAQTCIDIIEANKNILETYHAMLLDPEMKVRVCHHDTKISNVLFDSNGKGAFTMLSNIFGIISQKDVKY